MRSGLLDGVYRFMCSLYLGLRIAKLAIFFMHYMQLTGKGITILLPVLS